MTSKVLCLTSALLQIPGTWNQDFLFDSDLSSETYLSTSLLTSPKTVRLNFSLFHVGL